MADENAGSAWYELGARSDDLRDALRKAEGDIKRSGETGERAFATPMERATGRVAKGVREVGTELNSLSGKSPRELADALNRAEKEAEEALRAIKQIADADDDLSPDEARKYADALTELQVEADQTVAELRELQKADPRFDNDDLNRAAGLIDKIGDEAGETTGQLKRIAEGETHLEGVARAARHAGKELDNADGRAARFGKGLSSLKGIIVGLGVAFGLREALGKMREAINAASTLEESTSKVNVVFAEGAEDVIAWAESSATAFGQSKAAALEAAGTYGNLLQAFGVARPQAVEMSKTLVQLAADLASFNNTSVDEAIQALRSGLSGETEPLKRYGVAINDVRLKEEALRAGLIETAKGTLPVAVKAQAAYALILKDTALAQGDFARTSDGLANQERILAAEFENLMAEIGQEAIPLWKELIGFLRDPGIPIIKSVVGVIADTAHGIGEFVDNVSDDVRWLQIYFGDLGKTVEDRANEIGADVGAMKDDVLFAMNELGLGIDEAMEYAEDRLAGLPLAMTDVGRQSLASWKQSDMSQLPGEVGATMDAAAAAAAGSGIDDAISDPVEEGADDAVQAVESMYARIAAEIAERENALRAAGGDAVKAWLDPQVWRDQAEVVKAELVTANEELLEAQRNGTQAEVAEAQTRVAQLTAEAIELQQNLALTGTEMEQAAKLRALATSDFMLEGLSSNDEEIKRTFQEWKKQLLVQAGEMEREATDTGPEIPKRLQRGIDEHTPGVHAALRGLTSVRPDTSWAYGSGYALGSRFAAGMSAWVSEVKRVSIELGDAAAVGIRLRSPAKEGALSEDAAVWTSRLMDRWLGPLWGAVPEASSASKAIAAAVAGQLQLGALDGNGVRFAGVAGSARNVAGGGDISVPLTINVDGLVRAETPVDIGLQARRGARLGVRQAIAEGGR